MDTGSHGLHGIKYRAERIRKRVKHFVHFVFSYGSVRWVVKSLNAGFRLLPTRLRQIIAKGWHFTIPSFLLAHYFYIILWIIVASIMIYPVGNIAYIDALFFACGAATQGGLNTVDVNNITLWQQIVIYITTCLTTPVFIHSSIVFIRLYWFETRFENISERSKHQHKMRRTATLASRGRTKSSDVELGAVSAKHTGRAHSIPTAPTAPTAPAGPVGSTTPGGDSGENGMSHQPPGAHRDIRFGELPHPRALRAQRHSDAAFGSAKSGIELADFGSNRRTSTSTGNDESGDNGDEARNDPPQVLRSIQFLQQKHDEEQRVHENRSRGTTVDSAVQSDESPVGVVDGGGHSNDEDEDEELVVRSPYEVEQGKTPTEIKRPRDGKPAGSHDVSPTDSRLGSAHSSTSASRKLFKPSFHGSGEESGSSRPSSAWSSRRSSVRSTETDDENSPNDSDQDEEFHNHLEPSDVLRSISMLQKNRRPSEFEVGDGPALVVKGPRELDRGERHEFRRKPRGSSGKSGRLGRRRRASSFFKSGKLAVARLGARAAPHNVSAVESGPEDGDEETAGNLSDATCGDSDPSVRLSKDSLARTQSHITFPSGDATGGKKYSRRSNTIDVPAGSSEAKTEGKKPRRLTKLKRNLTNRLANAAPRNILPRRMSNFSLVSRNNSGSSGDDSDEEEDVRGHTFTRRRSRVTGNYLSWTPTIGRNSTFFGLTAQQKDELGGVEYRATKLLAKILSVYYLGIHAIAAVAFLGWMLSRSHYISIVRDFGVSPSWWAFFTAQSAFNDLGYTLTPNSMISFAGSAFVMIFMSFLIVLGNTGFPCALRLIVWLLYKLSRDLSQLRESAGFLLDHPRRCFTMLFPSAITWWLVFILVVLNGVDWILFLILDLRNKVFEEQGVATGYRVIDGLFQAFSTRTAGFAMTDLSLLAPGTQVSYFIMMYISVLPVAISIRTTNVYEEQSIGVFNRQETVIPEQSESKTFIQNHLRRQLSFDLWYIALGLFLECVIEGGRLSDPKEPDFHIFRVFFDIVSAYGTVGLSLGYPGFNTSFVGQYSTLGKLVMIAMMVRGRHRGLPYNLDRAIMLPSDKVDERDEIQALHHAATMEARELHAREQQMVQSIESVVKKTPLQKLWKTLSKGGSYLMEMGPSQKHVPLEFQRTLSRRNSAAVLGNSNSPGKQSSEE